MGDAGPCRPRKAGVRMDRIPTVVTGIGLVTAAGVGRAENLRRFRAGENGIRAVERFPLPGDKVRTDFAGLMPDVPVAALPADLASRLDPNDLAQDYIKAALFAAAEAVGEAGAAERIRAAPERCAIFVASSLGNFLNVSELVKDYFMKHLYKITSLIHGMNSYLPSRLAELLGARGPCLFVSSSCTSAANALLQADTLIRSGAIDRAVVCGVDVCLETGTYHLWNKLRVLSSRNDDPKGACRPYCATRTGLVVAEAAGCFLVERDARAAPGGAYAELLGIGYANGSGDFYKPSPPHLVDCIRFALAAAGVAAEEIDFVAGSASGSPYCDHYETDALAAAFGPHGVRVPLFSYKSHLGSTFGSQAVSEGALALMTFRAGEFPAPRNLTEPDPRIRANVRYDPAALRDAPLRRMLFLNHGFAGNHMAIVYGRAAE